MTRTVCLFAAFVFVSALPCAAELDASRMEKDWRCEDMSDSDRDELVEAAKKAPFEKVAPILLELLVEDRSFMWINLWGDKPWRDERLSLQAKPYWMARTAWQYHLKAGKDASKPRVLLSLIRKSSGEQEKLTLLISAVLNGHWSKEAEPLLHEIAKNPEEKRYTRLEAVRALLFRSDINKYMPMAIEIILAHEKRLPRHKAYCETLSIGGRIHALNEKNRELVISTGFEMLAELPAGELGYSIALRLGFILKEKNQFAPDQDLEIYKGEHGLAKAYFSDTVKNALKWHSDNRPKQSN